MSATIIAFPEARVFRSHDLVKAMQMVAHYEKKLSSADPMVRCSAEIMRQAWHRKLDKAAPARLTKDLR